MDVRVELWMRIYPNRRRLNHNEVLLFIYSVTGEKNNKKKHEYKLWRRVIHKQRVGIIVPLTKWFIELSFGNTNA